MVHGLLESGGSSCLRSQGTRPQTRGIDSGIVRRLCDASPGHIRAPWRGNCTKSALPPVFWRTA